MTLTRRVSQLEASRPAGLSPHAKTWLGQPLTPAEQAEVDAEPVPDLSAIDTSGYSRELKTWLGLN